MIYNKSNQLLFIIVFLAVLLRFTSLAIIPNGFYCDEASNGYDSFSILHTLKDQHGHFMPLFAEAQGDYRESLYIFLTIPFIHIFGLSEFATRLPASIVGVLTVLILYYLVQEMFKKNLLSLSASFLLAISPWHIQFSRIAFEAILFPFLFCLALLFFLKSLKNPNYLILSAITFAISLHTYKSARVFVPLFLIGLVIIFREHLLANRKQLFISILCFLSIFFPLLNFWISPQGMARANSLGTGKNFIFNLFHPLTYLSYFNPKFLFLHGDENLRHSPLNIGELNYFEIFTVPIGIFCLLKENRKLRFLFILWLFLYPVPAYIFTAGHAIRSIIGIPLFAIFSGYGFFKVVFWLKSRNRFFYQSVFIIVAINFFLYLKIYFIDYPTYSAAAWEYGIGEAITFAEEKNYNCVKVSSQIYPQESGGTHIFIPFYTQYQPSEYQEFNSNINAQIIDDLFSRKVTVTIGKYQIVSMKDKLVLADKCLFIIEPSKKNQIQQQGYKWKELKSVKDSGGTKLLQLLEVSD